MSSQEEKIIDLIDDMEKKLCCKHAVHEHTIQLIEETYRAKFQFHHQSLKFLRKKILESSIDSSDKLKLIERLQFKS